MASVSCVAGDLCGERPGPSGVDVECGLELMLSGGEAEGVGAGLVAEVTGDRDGATVERARSAVFDALTNPTNVSVEVV